MAEGQLPLTMGEEPKANARDTCADEFPFVTNYPPPSG